MKLRRAQQILIAKESREKQQVAKEEQVKKRTGDMKDILQRQHEFPQPLRVAIKEARAIYEDMDRGTTSSSTIEHYQYRESYKTGRFFEYFDVKVGCFLLRDNGYGVYQYGPDDTRDTEEEIETAVRYYLSTVDGRLNAKKIIVAQSKNFHGVSFIPKIAAIGQDHPNLFAPNERGGLITNEGNIINELAKRNYTDYNKRKCSEHQRIVDEKFLAIIERLRTMNLFTKNDIKKNHLIYAIYHSGTTYFSELRFRYLVNWNPASFAKYFTNNIKTGKKKTNPLHSIINFHKDMNAFRTVFTLTMEHFPLRIGWMFRKDTYGETPFQKASTKYGKENIKTILDEALNNQSQHDENFILKSYVIAASDESVDVECDFILLSRDPSIALQTLPQLQPSSLSSQGQQEVVVTKKTTTYLISGAVLRQCKKRKRNNATTFFDNMYLKTFLRGRKRQKQKNDTIDDDTDDDDQRNSMEDDNQMDWYEVEL